MPRTFAADADQVEFVRRVRCLGSQRKLDIITAAVFAIAIAIAMAASAIRRERYCRRRCWRKQRDVISNKLVRKLVQRAGCT